MEIRLWNNSSYLRRNRLNAGIRCHNRFYQSMANAVHWLKGGFDGRRLAHSQFKRLLFGIIETDKLLHDSASVTPLFEIELGFRRADFILLIDIPGEVKICLLVELKTCASRANKNSSIRALQYKEGLAQLRDTSRYIKGSISNGSDHIVIHPVLLFLSQKDLKIISITRVGATSLRGSFRNLSCHLIAHSTVNIKPKATASYKKRLIEGTSQNVQRSISSGVAPEPERTDDRILYPTLDKHAPDYIKTFVSVTEKHKGSSGIHGAGPNNRKPKVQTNRGKDRARTTSRKRRQPRGRGGHVLGFN